MGHYSIILGHFYFNSLIKYDIYTPKRFFRRFCSDEDVVAGYIDRMRTNILLIRVYKCIQIAGMIFQTHSNINLTFWIFSNVISVKITVVKIVIKINSRCHKTLSATSTIRYNIVLYYAFRKYVSLFL